MTPNGARAQGSTAKPSRLQSWQTRFAKTLAIRPRTNSLDHLQLEERELWLFRPDRLFPFWSKRKFSPCAPTLFPERFPFGTGAPGAVPQLWARLCDALFAFREPRKRAFVSFFSDTSELYQYGSPFGLNHRPGLLLRPALYL